MIKIGAQPGTNEAESASNLKILEEAEPVPSPIPGQHSACLASSHSVPFVLKLAMCLTESEIDGV